MAAKEIAGRSALPAAARRCVRCRTDGTLPAIRVQPAEVAEHHHRSTALVRAPTILSAALIAALVFLPALAIAGLWRGCALTLGVLTGNLADTITHHATHHRRADTTWLKRRKRWHALRHHVTQPGCYGVTTAFWDHAFGSAPRAVDGCRVGLRSSVA